MATPKVHIVHCIDTEGPLYESVEATFERLRHNLGVSIDADMDTLRQLQQKQIDLNGLEHEVARMVAPKLLNYNDTWSKIDQMLNRVMANSFRDKTKDSNEQGWIYNWFCVDHVGYDENPRRRDIGYHNIFDHYRHVIEKGQHTQDGLHFHFHPHAFQSQANLCATHWWSNSDTLLQTLCRRIIDRGWFPSVNRPGFQVTRPDSHWFLEQYIPFDFASLAMDLPASAELHHDFSNGRSGDWRRAPRTWEPYHPSHDDYQTKGSCRRWIARCLNVGTRIYEIESCHIQQAFSEAQQGKPVVLSFADHDFRDIGRDVTKIRSMLKTAQKKYPQVKLVHCEAIDAMREALNIPYEPPCGLDVELVSSGTGHELIVRTNTPSFGPQPFLALKTLSGTYHHDNFDFQIPKHEWSYTFDEETFDINALEAIGVAVNNAYGTTTVVRLYPKNGNICHNFFGENKAAILRHV